MTLVGAWRPGRRALLMAWIACVVPRAIVVAVLSSRVDPNTSSVGIAGGVFSSDLATPMWPPLYAAFAEVAWRASFGWLPLYAAIHVAAQALVGPAVLSLAGSLGIWRRSAWIAVAACALLPYWLAASLHQLDVGIAVAVASVAAAIIVENPGPIAGVAAFVWFLNRSDSVFASLALLTWTAAALPAVRARAGAAIATLALLLVAWAGINFARFAVFTPVPANGGSNFYLGQRPGVETRLADRSFNPADEAPIEPGVVGPEETGYALDRQAAAAAWRIVWRDPAREMRLIGLKFARYWDWRLSPAPPHPPAEEAAYTVPFLLMIALVPFGAAALWRGDRRGALAALLTLTIGFMAPHLAIFGLIRMRMTLEWAPILLAASAFGLRWSPRNADDRSAARVAR